ncbi:MAG: DNA-binding protein [Blastocatellia bacterium]
MTNNCFDGAYYLIGYAIECALKACIAKHTRRYDFPDRRAVIESHVHDLERLVRTAGLQGDLSIESGRDAKFSDNWGIVKDWDEESRYKSWTKSQSQDLYRAVTDRRHGVLRWVKQHW